MNEADLISEIVFTFFTLIILFVLNQKVLRLNKTDMRITWVRIICSVLLTLAVNKLFSMLFLFLHHSCGLPAINATIHHYLHPINDFLMLAMVCGGNYMVYLFRSQRKAILQNQQLQEQMAVSQYEALKSQLNPHMFFNSLNTLSLLVEKDEAAAQQYIQELSKVLRYTLQRNGDKGISLKQEMNFVTAYIYLLKMRYEDNLCFDFRIDDRLDTYELPPMAVQLLIENAVKHNEISSRNPLTISVYTEGENLVVSNPVQEKRGINKGTGIGLSNLMKRYELLYKKEIQIMRNETFRVILPLIPVT